MASALPPTQLTTVLATLPGWRIDGQALVRTDHAASFTEAMTWVMRVADAAEAANHHPDIDIRYRQVTWRLSTHDAGAITELDVALAHQIDAIVHV